MPWIETQLHPLWQNPTSLPVFMSHSATGASCIEDLTQYPSIRASASRLVEMPSEGR